MALTQTLEAGLKISNNPSAGQYLKYKDNTDKLTWTTAPGGAALTGSTNNTIVTVTGTDAIQGEANLTYDGDNLALAVDANGEGVNLTAAGNFYPEIEFNANRSAADNTLGYLNAKWNNTEVASLSFNAGADTTNKDDAYITFNTASAGTNTERFRIDSKGQISSRGTSTAYNGTGALDALQLYYETDSGQATVGSYSSGGSTHLSFFTNSGGNAGTEKLRIASDGKIGIGATAPQNLLHIDGASGATFLHLTNGTTGSASGDGSRIGIAASDSGLRIQNQENSYIRFETNGSERFRITSSGQLLSGTTSSNASDANAIFAGGTAAGTGNYGKIYISANETNPAADVAVGFLGFSLNGLNNHAFAYMGVYTDGAHNSNTDTPSRIIFATTPDGSGTPAERLRITSDGKIGIGTTAPLQPLDVLSASDSSIYISNSSTSASGKTWIQFGPSNNVTGSQIICQAEEDFSTGANRTAHLQFLTRLNGTLSEKVRIQAAGGISFNGDTAAANALDDYEEGTFTPTYGGGTDPTCSYDAQVGVYTKIGRLVTIHLRLRTDSVSGGSGNLKIKGLPFSSTNEPIFGAYITFTNHWKADSSPTLVHMGGNDNYFDLYNKADGNEDASAMITGDLNTTADDNDLRLTATYVV